MASDYPPPGAGGAGRAPRRAGLGPVQAVLVTAFVVAVTASLGRWQLSRAHQKEALQARVDARAGLPPLDAHGMARTADEAARQYDRRVTLTGRWLPAHTVLLGNRPMDGRTGFIVVTPLRATPTNTVVVLRGWVARDAVDPNRAPPYVTSADDVTIHGHIAPPPSRWFQLGPDAPGLIRQNLDLAAMQRASGAIERPLVVIEDSQDGAPDGLDRHWPGPTVTVARNYGYAVQWFAMSAAAVVLYVWLQFIRPRRGAQPS